MYDKVKESMGPLKIIILTHMPYADWTDEEPVPNWIYVNGHTHKNQFCIDDTKTVYADNQVGYSEKNVNLKYFYITKHYDIFVHYSDGIYEIKREEYIDSCRGLGIKIEFNRTNGQILMLKRDGIYCFLYRNNNEILYFLKGGDIRKLKHQNVQYFYDMMAIYKKAMEYVMNDYHNALKYISSQIKKIGGDGCIHGCIVDIDYFNHIYLNPANGEIKCYWALSIDYRQEYHNLEALLKDKRQDLYINYKQEFLENKNEMLIFKNNQLKYDSDMVRIVSDTSMYRPSNMLRSIQYMFDVNVIREWNEQTVERAIEKYLKGVTAIDATKKSPARISLSNSCAINRFGMEERMQDDSDISDYEGEIT